MTAIERIPIVPSDEFDLQQLLRVVWEYKILISVITAAFALAAVAFALIATPIYRGEVVVTEVTDQGVGGSQMNQLGGLASLVGVALMSGAPSQEARAILGSRRLVEEFIRRKDLAAKLFPESRKPPTLWFAVEEFQRRVLSIREDSLSGTKIIAIDWTDPNIAARWANEFVALANELIRARAQDTASRNIAYLREQIGQTSVVEMQQVMYSLIESEMKTLMLANGRIEYAFTVIDPAVAPEIRFRPRRTLMVLFGTLLGLCIGVATAFFLRRVPVFASGPDNAVAKSISAQS